MSLTVQCQTIKEFKFRPVKIMDKPEYEEHEFLFLVDLFNQIKQQDYRKTYLSTQKKIAQLDSSQGPLASILYCVAGIFHEYGLNGRSNHSEARACYALAKNLCFAHGAFNYAQFMLFNQKELIAKDERQADDHKIGYLEIYLDCLEEAIDHGDYVASLFKEEYLKKGEQVFSEITAESKLTELKVRFYHYYAENGYAKGIAEFVKLLQENIYFKGDEELACEWQVRLISTNI